MRSAKSTLLKSDTGCPTPRSLQPAPDTAYAGLRVRCLPELILCAVRWCLRYSLSFRDVEELLSERGWRRTTRQSGAGSGATVPSWRKGHRDPGARRPRGQHRHDDGQRKVGLRALRGFGRIRTRADPGKDPRWIGLCTSQGQEGRAPSRAVESAGAASSGSDGAARHEGQRAMPAARRNQGDDLPLRSARWFLEKPRATRGRQVLAR